MVLSLLCVFYIVLYFFFFKQKTAYEMLISDWSSDVCSSDLISMLVSLTLTPMMCAYLLKPDQLPEGDDAHERHAAAGKRTVWSRTVKIGRASCRERVCK